MTAADPVPAPLEANDSQRARALKAKIRDRVSDVRRHLLALRTAMAEFGDDFELDAFRVAYVLEDPVELNRVKAVEVETDVAGLAIARAPPGLHPPNAPTWNRSANGRFPLLDEPGYFGAQLPPLPVLQQLQSRVGVSVLWNAEEQPLAVEFNVRPPGPLDHLQPYAATRDVMRLACHHLTRRLASCVPQLPAPALDPRQLSVLIACLH